jgi:hypothetical protein
MLTLFRGIDAPEQEAIEDDMDVGIVTAPRVSIRLANAGRRAARVAIAGPMPLSGHSDAAAGASLTGVHRSGRTMRTGP